VSSHPKTPSSAGSSSGEARCSPSDVPSLGPHAHRHQVEGVRHDDHQMAKRSRGPATPGQRTQAPVPARARRANRRGGPGEEGCRRPTARQARAQQCDGSDRGTATNPGGGLSDRSSASTNPRTTGRSDVISSPLGLTTPRGSTSWRRRTSRPTRRNRLATRPRRRRRPARGKRRRGARSPAAWRRARHPRGEERGQADDA